MAFNPLVRFVMAAGKGDKKVVVYSDGNQSIAAAKVILDAVFDPLLAISCSFAGDSFTLAPELFDIGEDTLAFDRRQYSFFAIFAKLVELFDERPGAVNISCHM